MLTPPPTVFEWAEGPAADHPISRSGPLRLFMEHLVPAPWEHSAVLSNYSQTKIHPQVLRAGLRMQARKIKGSNCRVVEILTSILHLLENFTPRAYMGLEGQLERELNAHLDYIKSCRPHNLAVSNAAKWLLSEVHSLPYNLPADQTILALRNEISRFVNEKVVAASWRTAEFASTLHIEEGDVILTYSSSSAVRLALLMARKHHFTDFSVVVVDNAPLHEGLKLARDLSDAGIPVTYTLYSGASYHAARCTKVMLGGVAATSVGSIVNRLGAASIAMLGKHHCKPVFVLVEEYKSTQRGALGSFSFNELQSPSHLLGSDAASVAAAAASAGGALSRRPSQGPMEGAVCLKCEQKCFAPGVPFGIHGRHGIHAFDLLYDVTPPDLIDVIVTEAGSCPVATFNAIVSKRA